MGLGLGLGLGKKNRATVPRTALATIRFGLWDVYARGFILEGDEALSFATPKEALAALGVGHTDFSEVIAAELVEGGWDPPRAFTGDASDEVTALLALAEGS